MSKLSKLFGLILLVVVLGGCQTVPTETYYRGPAPFRGEIITQAPPVGMSEENALRWAELRLEEKEIDLRAQRDAQQVELRRQQEWRRQAEARAREESRRQATERQAELQQQKQIQRTAESIARSLERASRNLQNK